MEWAELAPRRNDAAERLSPGPISEALGPPRRYALPMGRYPTATAAQERLRTELLTSGLYDLVPLAEIESVITGEHLAATTAEQQELALSVVRSVIADGQMEVEGWDGIPLDEAMAPMHDLFITHYDDPGSWAFATGSG